MLKFKQILEKFNIHDAPSVNHDNRWLEKYHYKDYTDNPDEVKIKDLGLKMLDNEHMGSETGRAKHGISANYNLKHEYDKSALQKVPLDKVSYIQPSVNREKIKYFMKNYHPNVEDFHQKNGELRKYEAPTVYKYPDGTYVATDHHRLIASHLRGDTHAIARVYEYGTKKNSNGNTVYTQKKAKSDFK
jgi:hypothetical protein